MEGGAHFTDKELNAWSPTFSRPEVIEHDAVSVRNDYYGELLSILRGAEMVFPWETPKGLYFDNRGHYLSLKKDPVVRIVFTLQDVCVLY